MHKMYTSIVRHNGTLVRLVVEAQYTASTEQKRDKIYNSFFLRYHPGHHRHHPQQQKPFNPMGAIVLVESVCT